MIERGDGARDDLIGAEVRARIRENHGIDIAGTEQAVEPPWRTRPAD